MDVSKYRQLYLDESREHLQVMNRELLRLEQEGGTGGDVDALFRAAHSIKGMSGSMGFDAVVAVSHALEDVLDRLRKKTLAVGPGLIALLYEGLDALGALVAEIADKGATRQEVAGLAARLRGAAGGEAPPPPAAEVSGSEAVAVSGGIFDLGQERLAALGDLVRGGLVPYACQIRLDKDAAALGARNFVVLGRLGKAGRVLASSPTVGEIRAGAGRELIEALVLTGHPEDQLRAQLLAIPELRELRLRRLSVGGGEAAPTLLASRTATVERPAGAAPGVADRYAPRRVSTVRVETGVLDDLINIVGELLITRERLEEIGRELESRELHANLERLRVLVRGFQDTIMNVRMMPLELVTDRLPRIVRDLAHHSGKQVSFEVFGRGVELDRAIIEELNDVLIHLARNAIDHGVETPGERAAAGKPPKAEVRVRTGRERDWVWVRFEDDGRGMDPERIAGAAVARGLVSAARAAAMEPREKLLLCCLPGVSTAERVTDVSGRGVGMDAVKAKVDALGGVLQIDSQPGRGTAVTLRLPLTLAIVRVLLVEVRGQQYGLPVSHVLRTARLDPGDVDWSQGRPLLRLGPRRAPLHDLGALLGLPPRDLRAAAGLFLAVTEFGETTAGFAVDRLLGTSEVVVKPLGQPLKRVRGLAGVTVLRGGRTVLLLDPAALVTS